MIARLICRIRGHRWGAMRVQCVDPPPLDKPATVMYCVRCGKHVAGDSVRDGNYTYRALTADDLPKIDTTENA